MPCRIIIDYIAVAQAAEHQNRSLAAKKREAKKREARKAKGKPQK